MSANSKKVGTCSKCKRYVSIVPNTTICRACQKALTPRIRNVSLLVIDRDQLALIYPTGLFMAKEEWTGIRNRIERFYQSRSYDDMDIINRSVISNKAERQASLNSRNSTGYIYLARMLDKYYKIGLSIKPNERVSSLSQSSPFDVVKIHEFHTHRVGSVESALHDLFQDKKVKGEWFELCPSDVEWMMRFENGVTYIQVMSEISKYMEKRGVI